MFGGVPSQFSSSRALFGDRPSRLDPGRDLFASLTSPLTGAGSVFVRHPKRDASENPFRQSDDSSAFRSDGESAVIAVGRPHEQENYKEDHTKSFRRQMAGFRGALTRDSRAPQTVFRKKAVDSQY